MVLGTLLVSEKECGVKTNNNSLNVAIARLGQDLVDFDPDSRYGPLVRVKMKKAYEFITRKGRNYACHGMQDVLHRYLSDVIDTR